MQFCVYLCVCLKIYDMFFPQYVYFSKSELGSLMLLFTTALVYFRKRKDI